MGMNTKDEARKRLTRLGRSGKLPWCEEEVAMALPYISPKDLVLIPTAHALLRGILRSLLDFAFQTLVTSVPDNHPIVFSSESRKAVQVRPNSVALIQSSNMSVPGHLFWTEFLVHRHNTI
jgi:hypothetical protein